MSSELAKPIVGSLIGATVVMMVQQGLITGSGPKDPGEREALYRTGWQPYSIKVGEKYVPYGWNEPMGSVFGMAADFAELGQADNDYAWKISTAIGRNMLSKTFVTGLSRALDAMTDPERYGEQWLKSTAAGFMPASGLVGSLARMGDSVVRRQEGVIDAWKAKIPGLANTLMPQRDAWGRERERPGGWMAGLGIIPAGTTEASSDPVDTEVDRLKASVSVPSKKMAIKGKNYEFSAMEYDLYQMESGLNAYVGALGVIGKALSDEEKKKAIEHAVEKARRDWREAFKKREWPRLVQEAK
jgi:hypothetical protein